MAENIETTVVAQGQAGDTESDYRAAAEQVMSGALTEGQPQQEGAPETQDGQPHTPAAGVNNGDGQPSPNQQQSPNAQPENQKAPADKPEPPKQDADDRQKGNPLAAQYADLARREAKLQRRDMEIDQREKAIQERETGAADLRKLFQEDPAAALEKTGITFADLTRAILSKDDDKGQQNHSRLERDLKELREAQDALKREREEEKKAVAQQSREAEVKQLLDKGENFPLSRFHGQDAISFALQVQDIAEQEQGVKPPLDSVLQQVEGYYQEQASKLFQLPKVRQSLNIPDGPQQSSPEAQGAGKDQQQQTAAQATAQQVTKQPAQPETEQTPQSQQGQPEQAGKGTRTLTNDLEANASPRVPDSGPQTEEEYRQAALKMWAEMEQRS